MAKHSYLETGILAEQRSLTMRFLRNSLFWHLLIFIVLLGWSFLFPGEPLMIQPAIQIDVVALPDFTKNQLNTVDTTVPEKANAKAPEDIPAPTPDMMTLQKEAEKKAKAKPDPKKPEKKESSDSAENAIERLKKELAKKNKAEKKQLLEEKKKELEKFDEKFRPQLAGNTLSKGSNVSGASGTVINAYVGHIQDKIRANWELPPYLQKSDLRASVRLYIDNQGSARYFFSKSSGNDIFDNLVKEAIDRAKPFAPPPEDLAGQLKRNGVEVSFPL